MPRHRRLNLKDILSDIIPHTDNFYNIGTALKRIKDIHLAGVAYLPSISPAIGRLDLVAEVVAPANVQYLDVTGLDINTHKFYLIVLKIKNAFVMAINIYLFINGDYTVGNYWNQRLEAAASSVSASRTNSPTVMFVDADLENDCIIYLMRGVTGYASAIVHERGTLGSGVRLIQRAWTKTATVANITSIRISADTGSDIEAGSSVAVYGYRSG